MSARLQAADLRFINAVATRRFPGEQQATVDEAALAGALDATAEGTAFVRAAHLAAALLKGRVFGAAALQTALLAVHCSLTLDGLTLVAPQGVTAGMIEGLAGNEDPATVARWLEDRAVPSAAG